MERYENWVDRQVREAQERGEFDDLPGAGRPIPGVAKHDPNWWVKGLIEREKISAPLPPGLALRREVEQLPTALAGVRDEAAALSWSRTSTSGSSTSAGARPRPAFRWSCRRSTSRRPCSAGGRRGERAGG